MINLSSVCVVLNAFRLYQPSAWRAVLHLSSQFSILPATRRTAESKPLRVERAHHQTRRVELKTRQAIRFQDTTRRQIATFCLHTRHSY